MLRLFRLFLMPRIAGAVGVALALLVAAPAAADPKPSQSPDAPFSLKDPRIVAHFDFEAGQTPENIALEPDGSADLTFALARQVVRVDRHGGKRVLATLPDVADPQTPLLGVAVVSGIVRTHDGTLYVGYNTGTAETGIYRITPDRKVSKLVDMSPKGFVNGLALDEHLGLIYAADSVLGTVWRISLDDDEPEATAWATGAALEPTTFFGANGIKVRDHAVWVSNYDRGSLLRIPVDPDGSAGKIRTHATGLTGIDDFAFAGHGKTVLAALNTTASELALVRPDGTHTVVLTGKDGLSGPTAVAVRHHRVFVTSGAFLTGIDPNLLVADVEKGEEKPEDHGKPEKQGQDEGQDEDQDEDHGKPKDHGQQREDDGRH
ncbi:SMP-30/gluconolactonase/LRE family protein [Streptomyces sp. NRRL S-244]|uniref:SMP-30/gluconolactonase/LRE family protein n=1 Tax=Streptomyces sp. NRRL S-244 TaxID=1463897 RepID=UPI000B07828A|nr:SMP-30/gluconolactonase/LRE family protein [Streptomyces sp. NRRL S-244]